MRNPATVEVASRPTCFVCAAKPDVPGNPERAVRDQRHDILVLLLLTIISDSVLSTIDTAEVPGWTS
jgi:hypothetical protein